MSLDIIGVSLSLIAAYGLKFKLVQLSVIFLDQPFGTFYDHAQIEPYLGALWVLNLIAVICLYMAKGYQTTSEILPSVDEILKVVFGMCATVVIMILINFFVYFVPESRTVFLYFLLISIVVLSVIRLIILYIEQYFYSKGLGAKRAIIIGTTPLAQDIAERLILYPSLGYQYVGFIDDAPPEKIHYHLMDKFELLGAFGNLEKCCFDYNIDAIFITKRDISQFQFRKLMIFCRSNKIQFNILTQSILNYPFIEFNVFDGLPMISTKLLQGSFVSKLIKRLGDSVISGLCLVVFFPLLFSVGVWIKFVSPKGPIIFKQDRVGQHGRVFKMLKFRSMVQNAEKKTGPVMVDETDEKRYIKGGKFIRQWSLDELPQLWNVLMGNMSLVGPRPERPYFVEKFSKNVQFYKDRHHVPVGMTGWAQINGRSILTSRPEHKIKYDIYYINRWSLLFDLKILLKTCVIVMSKKESY